MNKHARQQVKLWNESWQVGCPVTVHLDNGKTISTETESEARMLGDHTAVIWLKGISGCYSLGRVSPNLDAQLKTANPPVP